MYFSVYAVALVLSNVRTISRGGRKKYYRKIDVEANHKVGEKTDRVNGKVVMLRTLLKTLQRHTFNAIIGICSIAHCVESGPFFCVANGFGLVDFPKFSHVVG